uniref:Serine dehydratase-like n=1 Tax=Cyprinus carpio TaxID=7962 RepID=A0A8C1Q9D0_CYPCA
SMISGNAGMATTYAARKLKLLATIDQGAMVKVIWDDANAEALCLAEREGLTVIHPFSLPLVWKGHSSIVHELKASLGIVEGLDEVGWGDVPVLFMETMGADCKPESQRSATCLGAKTACQQVFEYNKRPNVISEVVSDLQALEAVELFLDEERVLVELACRASLAAVYSGVIQRLQEEGRLPKPLDSLVMIVCGGGSMNLAQLQHLQAVIRK